MFAPISTLSYTSFSILSGVTFVFWLCSTFFLAFLSSERNLQFVYRRTILRAYEKSHVIRGRVHQTQTGHTRIIEQLGMSCTSIFLFHCQSRPQNKKYKQAKKRKKQKLKQKQKQKKILKHGAETSMHGI